ncbi:hypothetical protein C8J57DRAFT_1615335 [Mycena rebaudengoi]|nr:hypothetical protein C8J57DRAFT_1615335 [Mycena rebaudengoi]
MDPEFALRGLSKAIANSHFGLKKPLGGDVLELKKPLSDRACHAFCQISGPKKPPSGQPFRDFGPRKATSGTRKTRKFPPKKATFRTILGGSFTGPVVTLELTLDSLRQSSKAAHSEARGSAESIRADLGSQILILRQRIDALQKAAKERQETQAGHGGQVLGPSEVPPANRKASLSEALTMYTEVQRPSDALNARCSAFERSEKELVEENRRLEVKARAMTEEVVTAMELKSEAEKPFESEAEFQEDYDALTTANRELKRAVSELSAAQAESAAYSRACEEIALQTANAKSKLDKEFAELQFEYCTLKAKKGGKIDAVHSALRPNYSFILALELCGVLNTSRITDDHHECPETRPGQNYEIPRERCPSTPIDDEALEKLDKKYREQKDINVQLQKANQDICGVSYDDLSNNNKDLTQRFIMLQQNSLSTSKLTEEYESLKGRHQALQSTLEEMQESYNELQEGHEQLQQTCDDLERNAELMQPGQMALQDKDRRELEDRVRQLTQTSETIQAQMQTAVVRALYEDFMERFPSLIPGRRDFHFLKPICTTDVKSHAHVAFICKSRPIFTEARGVVIPAVCVHALAFGPTHHYSYSASLWIAGSDVSGLGGTTRDLFMADEDFYYVGTYKCHNLEHLYPGGTAAPEVVSPLEVIYAAHLGAMTPVDTAVVIKCFYPGGSILVGCVGLQCIGFDRSLYDTLRRRLNSGGTKCKADSDGP